MSSSNDTDFILEFEDFLVKYVAVNYNDRIADHQSLARYFNTPFERKIFWLAVGDLVEAHGYHWLSDEIRNGVCSVRCKESDHFSTCPLFAYNLYFPKCSMETEDLMETEYPIETETPMETQVDFSIETKTSQNVRSMQCVDSRALTESEKRQARSDMKEHLDLDFLDE